MGRLILTIILLVTGIIIFVVPVRGSLDQFDPINEKIADLNEALDNAGKIQLRRAELEADYNSLRAEDVTRLHKLLPSHVDNVRLIIEINDIAKSNNIVVTNINIGGEGSDEDPEDDSNIKVAAVGTLFETLSLNISAVGEYESFKKFLDELGKSLRVVDIITLGFNSKSNNDQLAGTSREAVYDYNIVLQTYWLKENQNE